MFSCILQQSYEVPAIAVCILPAQTLTHREVPDRTVNPRQSWGVSALEVQLLSWRSVTALYYRTWYHCSRVTREKTGVCALPHTARGHRCQAPPSHPVLPTPLLGGEELRRAGVRMWLLPTHPSPPQVSPFLSGGRKLPKTKRQIVSEQMRKSETCVCQSRNWSNTPSGTDSWLPR